MNKKLVAGSLVIAVLFASIGIYYYKAKIKADTAETLVGTRLQMVDTAGNLVKQNIPLELDFKATVRVCKVTKILFAKVSKCHWEDRNFKRVALTSNDGTYSVSTESYRPLTAKEAQVVVQNLAAEKAGRVLNTDEQSRLDHVSAAVAASSSSSQPTNAQVEGMVSDAFKSYTPPAADEATTAGTSTAPIAEMAKVALTTGAAVAAGSAATVAGLAIASGGGVTGAIAAISEVAGGISSSAGAVGSITGTVLQGARFLFTNPIGIAILATIIIIACFTSTKTTEKWFTLLSADVKPAGDLFSGGNTTLYYQTDKDTTSPQYVKTANFAVDNNAYDSSFYGAAADQLYAQFIAANTTMSDTSKNNYKTLLAANVEYLKYARLHGYAEANANQAIKDAIKSLVDGKQIVDIVNLVQNGSFEDGTNGWSVRHVGDGATEQIVTGTATSSSSSSPTSSSSSSASSTFTTCSNGSKCLKLASNKGTYQGAAQTFTNLEPGQKYRFSADYRTEGTGTLGEININDASLVKQYPLFAQGDSTWKRISVEIPAVAASVIEVILYGDNGGLGSGTVYWDNAVFEKVQ